jgi:hypothetical protein
LRDSSATGRRYTLCMETLFGAEEVRPWWRRHSGRFWLSVLSPVLILGFCTSVAVRAKRASATAEREVIAFRQLFAAGRYNDIYDRSAPSLRLKIGHDVLVRLLSTIHDKMGVCRPAARPQQGFWFADASGTSVRLQYRSDCQNGVLEESFTLIVSGDDARLATYRASSAFLAR